MEVVGYCTCARQRTGSCGCSSSNTNRVSSSSSSRPNAAGLGGLYRSFPMLFISLCSGALTCLFALAGALTGTVTGAFAGRASDSGVLRGAGLGALAGAVLYVEILQASRTYWCAVGPDSRSSPSMVSVRHHSLVPSIINRVGFIEEAFHGRLVRDHFIPTVFTDNRLQASIANINYDEMYGVHEQVISRGLSIQSLRKLPSNVITNQNKAGFDVSTYCTICLQDMEVGQTVRCLRRCHHLFHLTCVDKWLVKHGSCPVCRQNVSVS